MAVLVGAACRPRSAGPTPRTVDEVAGVRETWGDYGRRRQFVLGLSVLTGVGIFGLGVIGDWLGWWGALSYVPNAMTSLAGFFVGVPVALVFLSTWAGEREEKSQLDNLRSLSDSAWRDYYGRVSEFCSVERIVAYRVAGSAIADQWEQIAEGIRAYFGSDDLYAVAEMPTDQAYEAFIAQLPKWADDLDRVLSRAQQLRSLWDLRAEWVSIQQSWGLLNSYVKIQRFERKLPWIEPRIDARIQHKMALPEMPLTEFNRIHDTAGGYINGAMGDMSRYLRRCAEMTKDEIQQNMRGTSAPAYLFPVDEYRRRASDAADFLSDLMKYLSLAQAGSGWP